MRHEWIFDVLTDMKAYAEKHGLVALSAKVDETRAVARTEIAASGDDDLPTGQTAPPPRRRRN